MAEKYIIETEDPRGLKVRCTQKQWDEHIVSRTGHPEMSGKENVVTQTVSNPDYIFEDKEKPNERNVYIRNDTEHIKICTKVVAEIGGAYADIITAYSTKSSREKYEGRKLYEK